MTSPAFIPGLELNARFYAEVLRPLLTQQFPDLSFGAARLGSGSDVQGYDSPMSTDHDWGIRFHLFVSEAHFSLRQRIETVLADQLPATYLGWPVHFSPPNDQGTQLAEAWQEGRVNHRIQVTTVHRFVQELLHLDLQQSITAVRWLTIPQQFLLELTKGRVFADPSGELAAMQQRFAWFPHDVWLYLMACQWGRIHQEEHLVGRAGQAGDELGARLIGARLIHDVMQLLFLMRRQYAPYPKWFGTAFAALEESDEVKPLLTAVLDAQMWPQRDAALAQVYRWIAQQHNRLGITHPLPTEPQSFFERPFTVLPQGFMSALMDQIEDPHLKQIPYPIGSIDQFSHSTDLRSTAVLHRRLENLYAPLSASPSVRRTGE